MFTSLNTPQAPLRNRLDQGIKARPRFARTFLNIEQKEDIVHTKASRNQRSEALRRVAIEATGMSASDLLCRRITPRDEFRAAVQAAAKLAEKAA